MIRWLDVSAAPRNGTPVILWIEDKDAPPTYPVTVGVWETDDITEVSCWRVFADQTAPTTTSISTSAAGCHCLDYRMPDASSRTGHSAKPRRVREGQSEF